MSIHSCCYNCDLFTPAVPYWFGHPEECNFSENSVVQAHEDCPRLAELRAQVKEEAGFARWGEMHGGVVMTKCPGCGSIVIDGVLCDDCIEHCNDIPF